MKQHHSVFVEQSHQSSGRLRHSWAVLLLLFFLWLPLFLMFASEKPTQTASSIDNFNVEVIGTIGGEQITAIAAQGNYVVGGYSQALTGQQLTIWDVSNPDQISTVGQTAVLPYNIYEISLQGNYAYIAAGEAGVHVMDISNPYYLVEISSYASPAPARSVTLAGSYAYVAAGLAGMRVLDISQPDRPVEVSFLDTLGEANEIAVSGNYAYIADGFADYDYRGGLRIVDVSNPLTPQEAGFLHTWADVSRVELWGEYAFLVGYEPILGLSEVQKINISNPHHPTTELVSPSEQPGDYDITVISNTIYLTGDTYGYWKILDVTDLHTIRSVNGSGRINDISVTGDYAYVSNRCHGLQSMNVSTPHSPLPVGNDYKTIPFIYDIAFDLNYTYLAGAECGMQTVDLGNLGSPIEISDYSTSSYFTDIEMEGHYAYLFENFFRYLDIVNIDDPIVPVHLSYYEAPGSLVDVIPEQNELYIANSWGLDIVNISDPTDPTVTGRITSTLGAITGLDVQGDYAYLVGSYGSGLRIIDIMDPVNPIEIGYLAGDGEDVVVTEDFALIAAGENGLRLVDVSDPTQPVETAVYPPPGYAQSVLIHDNYLYVSGGEDGIFIFDISDLPYLILLGRYQTPYTSHVVVNENLIYGSSLDTIFILFQTVRSVRMTLQADSLLAYPDQHGLLTTIQIPAAAVTMPTTLVYAEAPFVHPPIGTAVVGHAFDLSAYQEGELQPQFSFAQPVTLTIPYRNADLGVITDTQDLSLLWYKDEQWREATTSCSSPSTAVLDTQKRLVTVPICQLGQYALTGPSHQALVPYIHTEAK